MLIIICCYILPVLLGISVLINAILALILENKKNIIKNLQNNIQSLEDDANADNIELFKLRHHPLIKWLRMHPGVNLEDIDIKEKHHD